MITLKRNIKTMQKYVICILSALLFKLKVNIFMKILPIILKKCFDTSNYNKNDNRPLPKGMNKKVLG